MPGSNGDDQRDDLDLDDDDIDGDGGTDGGDAGDGDSGDGQSGDGADKRIRDLQSKADKEAARANKAEAALAALKQGEGGAGSDPVTQALMSELRESALDAVFGEYPELREFGIDRVLIEGGTRKEIRENAASLVGLIKSVQTKVRNKTLSDHGIKAEPGGGKRERPVDYATMSDDDFEKLLNSI